MALASAAPASSVLAGQRRPGVRQRPFWGLFAVASAVFILDAVATLTVLPHVAGVREANPIAAAVVVAGPAMALGFKGLIAVQVGLTGAILRRLDAERAGRLLFLAMAALGSWGVGTALGVATLGG
jgi:Domain of unknown function (DUF5658)